METFTFKLLAPFRDWSLYILAFLAGAWLVSVPIGAAFPENLIYIGDDYTDSGNVATTPFTGSTQIWSTILGSEFGVNVQPSTQGGTNFAYAFALTGNTFLFPSLIEQATFIPKKLNRKDPVFIFGGANDIFFQNLFPFSASQTAANLLQVINEMHFQGFKTMVILNMFDAGAVSGIPSPLTHAELTTQTQQLNSLLVQEIDQLSYDVLQINFYSLLNDVIANPSIYGFINVTDPSPSPIDFNGYLFWSPIAFIHPFTVQFHQILADYVYSILQGGNYYSLLAEQPFTFLYGQHSAIRQQLFPAQLERDCGIIYPFVSGCFLPTANPPLGKQAKHYHSNSASGLSGFTCRIIEPLTVGMAYGYYNSESHDKTRGTKFKFDADANVVSLFGDYTLPDAYVNGIVDWGFLSYHNIKRTFVLGPATNVTHARTKGQEFSASIEGAYFVLNKLGNYQSGPFASLTYQSVEIDGYTEKGPSIGNLMFKDQTTDQVATGIGWELNSTHCFDYFVLTNDVVLAANALWGEGERKIHLRQRSLPGAWGVWPIYRPSPTWYFSGDVSLTGTFINGTGLTIGAGINYGMNHMNESYLTVDVNTPFTNLKIWNR